jgi:hypothetical protein
VAAVESRQIQALRYTTAATITEAPPSPHYIWEEVFCFHMVAEGEPLQNIPNKRVTRKIFSRKKLRAIHGQFCTNTGAFHCKIFQRKELGRSVYLGTACP